MSYSSDADLEAAIGAEVVRQILDDDSSGAADSASLALIDVEAQAIIDAKIENQYAIPLVAPVPTIIRMIHIKLKTILAYERHPEYVRAPTDKLFDRCMMYLDQIRSGKMGLDVESLPHPRNEIAVVRTGGAASVDATEEKLFLNGLGDF